MRVFVMVQPRFQPPLDQMPSLMEGFAAWRDRYRDRMEVFEFFAGGGGGIGIFQAEDELSLNQMILEYPFTLWSEITVRPIVRGDDALQQWRRAMQAMAQPA